MDFLDKIRLTNLTPRHPGVVGVVIKGVLKLHSDLCIECNTVPPILWLLLNTILTETSDWFVIFIQTKTIILKILCNLALISLNFIIFCLLKFSLFSRYLGDKLVFGCCFTVKFILFYKGAKLTLR